MLKTVKDLDRCALLASDGNIGKVGDVLFDDERWIVRYLVANTGSYLFGRKVLIAPAAFGTLDWERHALNLNVTKEQVEKSPGLQSDQPVSRQFEATYYSYYGWPYYWGGVGLYSDVGLYSGLAPFNPMAPVGAVTSASAQWNPGSTAGSTELGARTGGEMDKSSQYEDEHYHGDTHLRSAHEVTGYKIHASDAHLGHVDDFIFDDETWKIRYLAVDTRDWWPGKKVLLPLDWLGRIDWLDRSVTVDVTRETVRNAPQWDPREPIRPDFEVELSAYYAQQRVSIPSSAGITT